MRLRYAVLRLHLFGEHMDSAITLIEEAKSHEKCSSANKAGRRRFSRPSPADVHDAHAVAARGQQIYDRRYRADYEARYAGQFVVIDVESERAFNASTPSEAFDAALRESLSARLFLLK